MSKILGLDLDKYLGKPLAIPVEVKQLLNQREKVREDKDFRKSDELRKQIKKLGFEVQDTPFLLVLPTHHSKIDTPL